MIGRRGLLALPAVLAAGSVEAKTPPAAQPISRLDLKWWRLRHEQKLAELARVKPDLIWLGDSITQNFERDGEPAWAKFNTIWQRYYSQFRPVNLGFSGDATCHLLWRQMHGELDGISPKAAIILIGANNLGRLHWSAEDSVTGIQAVVSETQRRLPRTGILLLSVLPSARTSWASETTIAINEKLRQTYAGGRVAFQDVTQEFMRGQLLDRSLYYDPLLSPPEPPLHPTSEGLRRLSAAIEQNLARMMRT
jgi:lysophospholipase L1-like esterase